jgi:Zn-dependent metalloprotease
MKKIFCIALLLPIIIVQAQNKMYRVVSGHPIETEYAISSFKSIELNNAAKAKMTTVEEIVRDVQTSLLNNTSLIPEDTTYSLAGKHYSFVQYINNIPVYGASLKINTDLDGRITSVFNRTFEDHISPGAFQFPTDELAFNFASSFPRMTHFKNEQVYLWNGTGLVPGAAVWVEYDDHKKKEFVIDGQMQVLYSRDVNCYHHGGQNDSLVTALIFDPDPLTTANSQYVAPYLDNNDQDSPALNGQRQTVTFKAGYNNGTYSLAGPNVSVQDFSAPSTPTFSSTSNNWTFTRSQNEFEDLMVYYHIDSYVRYMRTLGFSGFMNYSIPVDAHALQGSDNAAFSPDVGAVTGRLLFGEGGVDDAEDADVILHELGHAMSHFVSQSNIGTERRSLDEAISDYFAVSYSSTVSSFRATDVFTWDGHNQYWNGRMCTTTKCYDNITVGGNI